MSIRSGLEFTKETKVQALRRANWSCEHCGIKKEDTEQRYLEIHHILPIQVFFYNPELFADITAEMITSIDNAMVLCKTCHGLFHTNEDLERHRLFANTLVHEFVQLRLF